MLCLRCGYCCHRYMVVIIDDPKKGLVEENFIVHEGNGPCKHLRGKKPGEYECAVHNCSWYKRTPCFRHGQIEASNDCLCRIGEFIMKKGEKEWKQIGLTK